MTSKVTLIFGEEATRRHIEGDKNRSSLQIFGTVEDYEFQTEDELKAFTKGVKAAVGWMEVMEWEDD